MTVALRGALRGFRRYLREATGEAKWDDYLAECSVAGQAPMSRRAFEQHRARQRECSARARCC